MKNDHQESVPIMAGLLLGTLLGIQQSNLGLWLSLGIALGAAIQCTINHLPNSRNINNEH